MTSQLTDTLLAYSEAPELMFGQEKVARLRNELKTADMNKIISDWRLGDEKMLEYYIVMTEPQRRQLVNMMDNKSGNLLTHFYIKISDFVENHKSLEILRFKEKVDSMAESEIIKDVNSITELFEYFIIGNSQKKEDLLDIMPETEKALWKPYLLAMIENFVNTWPELTIAKKKALMKHLTNRNGYMSKETAAARAWAAVAAARRAAEWASADSKKREEMLMRFSAENAVPSVWATNAEEEWILPAMNAVAKVGAKAARVAAEAEVAALAAEAEVATAAATTLRTSGGRRRTRSSFAYFKRRKTRYNTYRKKKRKTTKRRRY